MRTLSGAWLTILLGCTPALAQTDVPTQTETLTGTITPGNDQDYSLVVFDANGIFTAAYLPVEQEAGQSSFSVPVTVPLSGVLTEVVTVLAVYGGNGGVNDSPVSAVLNATSASAATAAATANAMNGPLAFSTAFQGANEVNVFDNLEAGQTSDLAALESFVGANASQFVTLTDGRGVGDVVPLAQMNPGAASFDLVVPEPSAFWLLTAGAAAMAFMAVLRRRALR